ncbi:MAG: hypothetical protein ACTSPW_08935 [Promethearchaeota archaeon]
MADLSFPIQGPLRFPLLVLEWLFFLMTLQLGIIFLFRYGRTEKEKRNSQEIGYASLLIGFSFMWLFFLISDYFCSDIIESPFYIWESGSERMIFLNFGYLSTILGGFLCIYFMERFRKYLITQYFFSYIFFALIIIFIISFFIDIKVTQNLTIIFWPVFLTFFFIYIIDFSKRVQSHQKVITGVLKFISGFFLIGIGYMFTTDMMIKMLGLEARVFGDILQLIAVIFIVYFLITLPPFSEFNWKEKLENLFLINQEGICIHNYSFNDKTVIMDENLISASLSSVGIMLNELTNAKGMTILKKKGKIITIIPGKYSFGVIFSSEDLNYPKVLLHEYVKQFESLYQNILLNWDGDLNVFKPIEQLTKNIFLEK